MPGHKEFKICHCLNRLMLTEKKNPDEINPYDILREFCDFEDLPEMKKLYRKSCKAALSGKYSWKEGSPGNLLYFFEQLEGLVEACFLIYNKKGFKKQVLKRAVTQSGKKAVIPELPCSLSLEEYMNPLIVIEDFFDKQSLFDRKRALHSWMEAGLSDFSVLENIKSDELLPYRDGMEKLLEASYRIVLSTNKKGKLS